MDEIDENLLDVDDYRQIVLEIILSGKHVTQPVSRLRLVLFIRAAIYYYSHNQHQCLEPFPACFFDRVTNTRLYGELRTHILNIPALDTIQETTSLPVLTWKLLHWIFTNPLDIRAITEPAIRDVLTDDLREKTKLSSIPYPSNTCTLYEINPPVPKKAFIAGKKEFGSFYGYHGSPAQNFHSIIHRGLICSLNVVGAYGYGTYLSSDLNTAKTYAQKYVHSQNLQNNQSSSDLTGLSVTHVTGNSYCIAIVEVVNHPSIKLVNIDGRHNQYTHGNTHNSINNPNPIKYYVVDRNEFMQLRNLLVFENEQMFDFY